MQAMQGKLCVAAADIYKDVAYGRSYQISADALTLLVLKLCANAFGIIVRLSKNSTRIVGKQD